MIWMIRQLVGIDVEIEIEIGSWGTQEPESLMHLSKKLELGK